MSSVSDARDVVRSGPRLGVRYQRPWLPASQQVMDYYRLAEDARYYSNGGPCLRLLQERLSDRLGGPHCVLMANCTLAIAVALRAALPSARGLVAIPAYSFTATAGAVRLAGFEPLFVDVEPEGWQMDPLELSAALERHRGEVAGVLGCSTFGTPARPAATQAWRIAAAEHQVPFLLDSAAAFGAVDDAGRPSGARGDTEVFSFHATKPFAIGEGGLLVTSDAGLAERARQLQNFGFDPVTHTSTVAGFNAKLSELAAACGLAMLDAFDVQLARRRAHAEALRTGLAGLGLGWQQGASGSTWQVVPVVAPDERTRASVLAAAAAGGVEVRTPFDPPLHRHPAFAGAQRHGDLRVSEDLARRTIALPMANDLTPDERSQIVAAVWRGL